MKRVTEERMAEIFVGCARMTEAEAESLRAELRAARAVVDATRRYLEVLNTPAIGDDAACLALNAFATCLTPYDALFAAPEPPTPEPAPTALERAHRIGERGGLRSAPVQWIAEAIEAAVAAERARAAREGGV